MVKSEVGCRGEDTPYLTVSDAEMTGFHEEVNISNLNIPRGIPWKGVRYFCEDGRRSSVDHEAL